MKTKLKHPEIVCCSNPDIKNEGYVRVDGSIIWEYHCYTCGKSWTEVDRRHVLSKDRF